MIKPLNSNILVELIKQDKTESGIYVADSGQDETCKAKVLAADSELVKEGELIMFARGSATKIKDGQEDKYFIEESDVIATYVD